MDQSGSQYYDSGPFLANRTGSTLIVGETDNESDKRDDGGVVLHKITRHFESGSDSEISETFVKEKVKSADKVSAGVIPDTPFIIH